jgi:hypothetical protein
MGLKLPPEFVNTPAHDVFNMALPDSVYRTLAVLHGLAWQTKGERTPPTTVLELAALRNLKERQMYTHLRTLKELKRIRVDNLGHGRLVIYPLRWEPDAALSSDDQSTLTEAELALLADESETPPEPEARSPGEVTAKNCSTTAKNYSTAKNCSEHVVKHVVDADSDDSESKQQQHDSHVTAKNCSKSDLIEGIAGIFVADGDTSEMAEPKAASLIEKYGDERCQRQWSVFARRCELAQASEEGLRNPSGLFIRSVQQDWPPPPPTNQKSPKTWYTADEFDELIEH